MDVFPSLGLTRPKRLTAAFAALAWLTALGAAAARAEPAAIAQSGAEVDAIRAMLAQIRLPAGFAIELYARVPGARSIAVAPGGTVFVGTREATVWQVRTAGGPAAIRVEPFAPGFEFRDPNGVCFDAAGELIVAERNRVLRFPATREGPSAASPITVVAQGRLVPAADESDGHGARVCRVGPDGRLYITIGQPYNVPPLAKLQYYREAGIGGIVRMKLDGSQREVYAVGIRNSVGLDFNPADGSLWFTDNQTDKLGDDVPPGELNHATRAGQDFGYPYWNGHFKVAGSAVAPDLAALPPPADAVFPRVEFQAHQAQLGMRFYGGATFPPRYRGGIFVAAHGSWNRRQPTGALVDFVPLSGAEQTGPTEVFAQGFLDAAGQYRGRPVDVAVAPDGSLLVSDDFRGALYRIRYQAP